MNIKRLKTTLINLNYLAQGGTAVGTGLNTKKGFDRLVANEISKINKIKFKPASNKFQALASHDSLVELSGVLNVIATDLFKIANDIRLLASGPRSGLGELNLPENEPGSSIMPGKVNPTQSEALTMACLQVMGSHNVISMAGTQGHFELNAFKPVIGFNIINSINLFLDKGSTIWITLFKLREFIFCFIDLELDTQIILTGKSRSLILLEICNIDKTPL